MADPDPIITVTSLADLIEAVRVHAGEANVRIAFVDCLRRAPTIFALLSPMVEEFGWDSQKLEYLAVACDVERELDLIYAVVVPRILLEITPPTQDPTPSLEILGRHSMRALQLAQLAQFTLADGMALLTLTVAGVIKKFEADKDYHALSEGIDDVEMLLRDIREAPFSFTVESSSDDEP